MTKNDIFKFLKPIILYLLAIVASYYLRTIYVMPVLVLSVLIAAVAPIVLLLWNVKLIRAQEQEINRYFVFGLYALPGLLFGLQLILDLIEMMYGYFPGNLILHLVLFALISGLVFGFTGILLQYRLKENIFKKLIIVALLGAVFGALLFYGALDFIYSNHVVVQTKIAEILLNIFLSPIFIGILLCDLVDAHSMAVDFYVFPFVYSVFFSAVYLIYYRFRKLFQQKS